MGIRFEEEYLKEITEDHLSLDEDKLIDLGGRFSINPAILLGRACHEMNFYAVKMKIDKTLK